VDLQEELAALKRRRRSVRPDQMHALLTAAGFERRYGKGDHWVYTHPNRQFPLTVDPRNPLLPTYVSKAIRAIEEVLADESDEEDKNA
jgi:predicted RNA binding protein YcfA (HicA-like mRNA interferase family)